MDTKCAGELVDYEDYDDLSEALSAAETYLANLLGRMAPAEIAERFEIFVRLNLRTELANIKHHGDE
jgi:hypothetical protein